MVLSGLLLVLSSAAICAERVTVKLPSGQVAPCDISKVTPEAVTLRPSGGALLTIALEKLDPKEVAQCYKQVTPPAAAADRFKIGQYLFKNKLFDEAEAELNATIGVDASYRAKSEAMLAAIAATKKVETPPEKKKDDKKIRIVKVGPDGESDEESTGSLEDFAKKFGKKNVPARSAEEMKAFLDKRQEELKKLGGAWLMKETKHFYCFTNCGAPKLEMFAAWNERLYDRLCVVLKHKESDKLWNNKMPIYYFEKYGQFQNFAAEIDGSPGAGYSGGYFSAQGRDVHICIPIMTERLGSRAEDNAMNTLHHECTHAFLQLTGEDVELARWLHEGMAQFIEFWYAREKKNNHREQDDRALFLAREVKSGNIPTWEEMRERPRGGMDLPGYAFAWSKLEFLYRSFQDVQKLPNMIHKIKEGKPEAKAMEEAFGFSPSKLEEVYRKWMQENGPKNFKILMGG
jgi:hypothetical protein